MAGGQRYELTMVSLEKRIASDGKGTGPLFDERGECGLEVTLGAGFHYDQSSPQRL